MHHFQCNKNVGFSLKRQREYEMSVIFCNLCLTEKKWNVRTVSYELLFPVRTVLTCAMSLLVARTCPMGLSLQLLHYARVLLEHLGYVSAARSTISPSLL